MGLVDYKISQEQRTAQAYTVAIRLYAGAYGPVSVPVEMLTKEEVLTAKIDLKTGLATVTRYLRSKLLDTITLTFPPDTDRADALAKVDDLVSRYAVCAEVEPIEYQRTGACLLAKTDILGVTAIKAEDVKLKDVAPSAGLEVAR